MLAATDGSRGKVRPSGITPLTLVALFPGRVIPLQYTLKSLQRPISCLRDGPPYRSIAGRYRREHFQRLAEYRISGQGFMRADCITWGSGGQIGALHPEKNLQSCGRPQSPRGPQSIGYTVHRSVMSGSTACRYFAAEGPPTPSDLTARLRRLTPALTP